MGMQEKQKAALPAELYMIRVRGTDWTGKPYETFYGPYTKSGHKTSLSYFKSTRSYKTGQTEVKVLIAEPEWKEV